MDAQPSNDAGGILVLVAGRLLVRRLQVAITYFKADHLTSQVDEEQRPMSYTQSFQLLPDGAGSYYVFNDIFRLVYAAA